MLHAKYLMPFAVLLSGCTFNLNPTPDEYTGSDAAHIRVEDSGVTTFRVYNKVGNCYKKTSEKRLTSAITLIGLPTTTGKKIPGMKPSTDIGGLAMKEYSIQPGQRLLVVHYYDEVHTYGTYQKSFSASFIPEPNHDYDLIVGNYSINIKDLKNPDAKVESWNDKICD